VDLGMLDRGRDVDILGGGDASVSAVPPRLVSLTPLVFTVFVLDVVW